MLDVNDHGPLTEADLERVRSQLRDALDRLRDTVERTQRVFYEMRLRVAESTSDNGGEPAHDGRAMHHDGTAYPRDGQDPARAPRGAVERGFREQEMHYEPDDYEPDAAPPSRLGSRPRG